MAYGYRLQGGLSGYNVIDQRILNGDDGNYLIPVQPATGYAESALDRAVGLRHRGLRPEISQRVESWRHGVDRRRPNRGQGSGVREQFLHDQRRFRCSVTPCRDCC